MFQLLFNCVQLFSGDFSSFGDTTEKVNAFHFSIVAGRVALAEGTSGVIPRDVSSVELLLRSSDLELRRAADRIVSSSLQVLFRTQNSPSRYST